MSKTGRFKTAENPYSNP